MAQSPNFLARLQAWFRSAMPTQQALRDNRYTRPFAGRILRGELWRFTRHSVPRGVALGLLVGIIIPVAQTLFAALFALPVRANVPVAAATTFVTNPVTTPVIWVVAYKVGEFLLRVDAMTYGKPVNTAVHASALGEWMRWMTDQAGVLAFGLVVVAVISAALGYLLSAWGWRWWILRKRRRDLARRRAR